MVMLEQSLHQREGRRCVFLSSQTTALQLIYVRDKSPEELYGE